MCFFLLLFVLCSFIKCLYCPCHNLGTKKWRKFFHLANGKCFSFNLKSHSHFLCVFLWLDTDLTRSLTWSMTSTPPVTPEGCWHTAVGHQSQPFPTWESSPCWAPRVQLPWGPLAEGGEGDGGTKVPRHVWVTVHAVYWTISHVSEA